YWTIRHYEYPSHKVPPLFKPPAKLRAHIWELTIEPRIVEVRECIHGQGPINVRRPGSGAQTLQTCHEARVHQTKHADDEYRYGKTLGGDPGRERYVWFNFGSDMLSIGDIDLQEFLAVDYQICRLRLRRNLDDEYLSRIESISIDRRFMNIVEIHLILFLGALGQAT
ncbi:hypothetical protein GCG54_00010765, partial [Colletotrichum gloeosporioides]